MICIYIYNIASHPLKSFPTNRKESDLFCWGGEKKKENRDWNRCFHMTLVGAKRR